MTVPSPPFFQPKNDDEKVTECDSCCRFKSFKSFKSFVPRQICEIIKESRRKVYSYREKVYGYREKVYGYREKVYSYRELKSRKVYSYREGKCLFFQGLFERCTVIGKRCTVIGNSKNYNLFNVLER